MQNNPANDLKDVMWGFLMDRGQKANIPVLKETVYDLIQMSTQKTAGQDGYKKKDHINWKEFDMISMTIVIEATALVLSRKLDDIMALDKEVLADILTDHKLCDRQREELQKVVELIIDLDEINHE